MKRLALILALASAASAAPRWIRLHSERFEVFTTAGEPAARSLLEHLDQARRVFAGFAPGDRGVPLPIRVYLFGAESDFAGYRPADSTGGFFQSGPVRDIIALPDRGRENTRVAMHEFVHLVLSHAAPVLPRWFEEGTAEFYSTLRVAGDTVRLGGLIPSRLEALRSEKWLDADAFARIERDSPEYNRRDKANVFYAQSWALTHMLNLAPGWRERMPHYIELLAAGQGRDTAFETAFGKPLAAAFQDLRGYVSARRFRVVDVAAGLELEASPVTVHTVGAEEAERALSELAVQTGRLREAAKAYEAIGRDPAVSAEKEERMGMLALALHRDREALEHLGRAIRLGTRNAETHFEYAMLLRDTGGDSGQVLAHLRQAVELQPNYAEAHFLLGLQAAADKRSSAAILHFQQAVRVLPRQSQFWHALALAAHEAGDEAEARRAARRARDAAAGRREIEMADAALDLVASPKPPPRFPQPAVTTPPGWENPKGDRRVEGTLTRIDCLGQAARLAVASGGREVPLYVARPGEVLLKNLSSLTFEFRCGAQDARPVAVEYLARPDARTATEGDVTAIEFR
ncbi:MAG: tetratricopeptide repeat protein [Acidobacteria bacterium]|nr:tetratricopeptide repeat protein [Acidobacteriota bacterium]